MRNIETNGDSVYLITDSLARKYFSGIDLDEGILLVGESLTYFIDARYFSAAAKECEKVGINSVLYRSDEDVKDFLSDLNVKTLYVDFDRTTVSRYNAYLEWGFEIKDCSDVVKKIRSVKDDEERSLLRKACKIAQEAYYSALEKLSVGITEKEIADYIQNKMTECGANGASFDIIVAFGSNSAVPHHKTGDTRLKNDMPVLIDMGANYCGYMSDLTRTCFFGTPSDDFVNAYQATLGANLLAEEKIFEGISVSEADKIARDYLTKCGYGNAFTHSLGHGVGLEIHEYPFLSPKGKGNIVSGMAFTVEPGVYFDGKFGVRIEDTVLMNGGKVERLFTDDKRLIIIKK